MEGAIVAGDGFQDLSSSITDAVELLAAFVSLGRSNELPPSAMLEFASRTADDLGHWKLALRSLSKESYIVGPFDDISD